MTAKEIEKYQNLLLKHANEQYAKLIVGAPTYPKQKEIKSVHAAYTKGIADACAYLKIQTNKPERSE